MTSTFTSRSGTRYAGIDALRGLAIILVVALHVGLRVPLRDSALADVLPRSFLNALNYNGYQGVFIFFTLSGFLIASHTIRRWGSLARINVREFYLRRAARILPLLMLLLAMLSALHLFGAPKFVIDRPGQSLPRALLAALTLHLNWYEGQTGYLPASWDVLWSLSIEEAFYLAFPMLCLTLRSRAALVTLLAILGLSLPVWKVLVLGDVWNEKHYLPGFAAIALGVLGARYATDKDLRVTRRSATAIAVVGLIGLIAALFANRWLWPLIGNGHLLLLTLSTMVLVFGLYRYDATGPPLRLRSLAWLQSFGRLSYEIYLTHMFVVWPSVLAFKSSGLDARWGAAIYPPAILLCWALGTLVARFISQPAEMWLKTRYLRPRA